MSDVPVVLFGAFDRHNLGDLLLAHITARECRRPALFAGLRRRDLRGVSGHAVEALDDLIARWPGEHGDAPLELIHVGGELLDCDLWQAAVMLCEPDEAARIVARYDARADAGRRWAKRRLRLARRAPYVVAASDLPRGTTAFRAVGGADFAERPRAYRVQVLVALRQAARLSVRDRATQACLAAAGIAAALEPDPATRIAQLFADRIGAVRTGIDAPYVALQFAAECGDDATLDAFARGARRLAAGAPIVLFRAGAAPWHDALEPYRRLAARLGAQCRIFEALDVWQTCALIAGARACAATSLHARLVAEAFGVPAVSLERAPGAARKLRAYLATWQPEAEVLAPEPFAAASF